jgi:hypothetical protein
MGLTSCLVDTTGDGSGVCSPHFADGISCEPECDASNVVILDGNSNPNSACLPPCSTGSDCPDGFLGLCSEEGVCGL